MSSAPEGLRLQIPTHLKQTESPRLDAKGAVALDAIDQQLISHVMGDGRIGNRALAGLVGVSEVTVASRLRQLVDSGVLVFTAVLDWEAMGFEWFVRARVSTQGRAPRAVAKDLAALPGCIVSGSVYGQFDVLAYFLLTDRDEMRTMVLDELSSVSGLARADFDAALSTTVTSLGLTTFLAHGVEDLRIPNPATPLDSTDVGIIEALLEDGRQSSRRIGRSLSVSEGTVRFRMGRMLDSGLLKVVAMVNPIAVGLAGVIADLSIRVRRDLLDDVHRKLAALDDVAVVATTLGSADLAAVVTAPTRDALVEVLHRHVRAIDGLTDVTSLEMTELVRFNPFLKRIHS